MTSQKSSFSSISLSKILIVLLSAVASMGFGSGGQGGHAPRIFTHGTYIVNRGLIVLFFGLFCYFSVFFSVGPPLEKA